VSPHFDVQLAAGPYAPGDVVRGTVLVVEGGGSRVLEAVLEYHEKTDDYEETPVQIASGPLHSGELATGTSYGFELQLPPDALPGYKSKHGELYWELDVKSDERGRDTHERRRIDVAARRAE
jgi:hypothetical protein